MKTTPKPKATKKSKGELVGPPPPPPPLAGVVVADGAAVDVGDGIEVGGDVVVMLGS